MTSTIIGPKTMAQLDELLGAADLVLVDDVLDAVDAIVPPGTDAPKTQHYIANPGLEVQSRRRRP